MASCKCGRSYDDTVEGVYRGGDCCGIVLVVADIVLVGVPNAVFHDLQGRSAGDLDIQKSTLRDLVPYSKIRVGFHAASSFPRDELDNWGCL